MKFGSTVDVECANFAVAYESHLKKKAEKGHKITPHTTDQLKAMIDAVKKGKT
jgi:hypothetical protein